MTEDEDVLDLIPVDDEEPGTDIVPIDDDEEELEQDERDERAGLIPLYDSNYKHVESITPDELDQRIAAGEQELRELVADATNFAQKPEEQLDEDTGTALVLHGQTDAVVVRKNMAQLRAQALKTSKAVAAKQSELRALMKVKSREIERVMQQAIEPLEKMVAVLQEGIWTVNLYLGREEEIVTLSEGERAPADTPITMRQLVLAMDQETAVAAEHGGIDARSFRAFDEWVVAHPSHLEQVFPHPKGIVALVPRWNSETGIKDHGSIQATMGVAAANNETYFLIRNGECLYRVAPNEFSMGRHLIPPADEFTQFFVDKKTGEQLQPGTQEWVDAEKKADKRQRHFMRVALILQGLVDRTAVLHPLPEGGLNLLTQEEYLSGKVDLVLDAEKLLVTGRESFTQWRDRINAQLRTGMRIIGAFESQDWERANKNEDSEYGRGRITPKKASKPVTGEIYTLEERKDGGWLFRYKRTDKVERKVVTHRKGDKHPDTDDKIKNPEGTYYVYRYTGYDYVTEPPKTRASCLVRADDTFYIAYDLAKVEDMEYFLQSRLNRKEYVDMFPVLKAAIAAKKAEAAEEEPFRLMLVGALAQAAGDIEDAEQSVDDLIMWWKLGTKTHRALTSDDAKAVRDITKEYVGRRKARGADSAMVEKLLRKHPEALLIGRNKAGEYQVYEACDDRPVFVRWSAYTATGKPQARWDGANVKDWHLPQPSSFNRWEQVHVADAWRKWDFGALLANHITGPELEQLIAELRATHKQALSIHYHEDASYYDGPICMFRVSRLPDKPKYPELPLGESPGRLELDTVDYAWSRKGREGRVVLSKAYRSYWSSSKSTSVYESAPLRKKWNAMKDEHAAFNKVESRYSSLSYKASQSIIEQWEEAQWKIIFDKFMEDVGDAELWEDHKQTFRVKYPHGDAGHLQSPYQRSNYWHNDGLNDVIDRLIERDVDLNGMTMQEAYDKVAELVPDAIAEVAPPHEEIAQLVFAYVVVEPEEDDEPWEDDEDD